MKQPKIWLLGSVRWAMLIAVMVLIPTVQIGHAITFLGVAQCAESQEDLITTLLPSIEKFSIMEGASIISSAFSKVESAPEGFFSIDVSLSGSLNATLDLLPTPFQFENETYTGTVDGNENSLASLMIKLPRGTEEGIIEGRIAGFVIRDLDLEANLVNNPENNWYVFEPVRPLLKGVLARSSACSEADIERLFPIGNERDGLRAWTIIYEVRDTNFSINLDPYGVDEAPSTEAQQTHDGYEAIVLSSVKSANLAKNMLQTSCKIVACEVDLYLLADQAFLNLKGSEQEALSDIYSVLNILLNGNNNFFSLFGANVKINPIQIQIPPSVSPGAQFSDAPNAYQLLCDVLQKNEHAHSTTRPSIVHLFTGYDLVDFPDIDSQSKRNISDSADGFCTDPCGGEGKAIVGLAEGIGGFREKNSLINSSCNPSGNGTIIKFETPGHHSLSQHKAKLDITGETSNFDGTLFQRWVLVAHEIGHNLGARHVDDSSTQIKSVMNSTITGKLNYYLETKNTEQINN